MRAKGLDTRALSELSGVSFTLIKGFLECQNDLSSIRVARVLEALGLVIGVEAPK